MRYLVKVEKIDAWAIYMGTVCFTVSGKEYRARYQSYYPDAKVMQYEKGLVELDIWLEDGVVQSKYKMKQSGIKFIRRVGHIIQGTILESSLDNHTIKIDCRDLVIDAEVKNNVQLEIGKMICIEGTMQVYFPDPDWQREAAQPD